MVTRRALLVSSAAIGTLAFAATLPGLRAAAQPQPLRRSLKAMDLDDPVLTTLRAFVTMMKDPSRNGQNVSWVAFSDIHGSLAGGFNKCPHGNWYFLPWHRGYILMYEAAARALTGDTGFAMPYWDWTEQPDFPAAFGDATFEGQPNPLFVAGRAMVTGDAMAPTVTGQAVLDAIYASQTFEEFGSSRATGQNSADPIWIGMRGTQGELEFNPHNNVHCDVAGPFMCSGASPQDPIFVMHHCNIDRIWDEWNFRGNPNSPDAMWLDMAFTDHFFDPDGSARSWLVNQLLQVEPLGYTYRTAPTPPEQPVPPVPDPGRSLYLAALYGGTPGLEAMVANRAIGGAGARAEPNMPLSVPLDAGGVNLARALEPSLEAALQTARAPVPQVYAFIRHLEPAEGHETQLRVFVNLPEAAAETPVDHPNFVTTIGFFGPSTIHDGHDMRPSVAVNLTSALQRLTAAGAPPGDEITIQLVPVPTLSGGDAGSVGVTEVELAVV